jgi:signal transduction histidine kinase
MRSSEKVKTLEEKHTRAAQRLTTQYAVARILAESDTLDEATPRILQAICETLEWDMGSLWIVNRDADLLHCVKIWHKPSVRKRGFINHSRQITLPPGVGIPGRVWASGEPVWIADVTKDTNFPRLSVAVKDGLHSAFCFPILLGSEVQGVLEFFSHETRRPDKDLLETFATTGSQIGQFIERKRAEESLKTRARQQAVVAELGQQALTGTDPHKLMADAALLIAQCLEVEYTAILKLLQDKKALLLSTGVGWKRGLIGNARIEAANNSLAGFMLDMNEPVIFEDLKTETKFSAPTLLHKAGVVSGICIPIPGLDQPFGILCVFAKKRRYFTRGDVHFLQASANIVASSMERKWAEESRIRLLERVILAQEQERRWIARELHDETGQSITSLLVGLKMIEDARKIKDARVQANRLRRITAQTLDDLGRLARGLHPSVLDDLGLVVAITRYAADYGDSYNIAVEVRTEGLDSCRLPPPVETALYRIVQEALTNIARHAGAKNVSIILYRRPSDIQAVVEDDGCGFDVETKLRTSASSNHLGLYGMRERAALLGGYITIKSRQGKGTTISVHIPLQERDVKPQRHKEQKDF